MLPPKIQALCDRFALQAEEFRGQDMCGWVAAEFARLLAANGIESQILQMVEPELGTEHEVNLVAGWIVDWSAEQFDPACGFPFVAFDLDDYAEHGLFFREQKRVDYFAAAVVDMGGGTV